MTENMRPLEGCKVWEEVTALGRKNVIIEYPSGTARVLLMGLVSKVDTVSALLLAESLGAKIVTADGTPRLMPIVCATPVKGKFTED